MLGTPNYSLTTGPCMHCQCKMTGPVTWSDFRSEAAWRTTRWDPEEWRTWEQRTKCVLLTLPGASCWTIAYDWVHVKYLGVDQYIFGSVLFVLVCMVMEGEQEANLAACWAFLKTFFETTRRQHHSAIWQNFRCSSEVAANTPNYVAKLQKFATSERLCWPCGTSFPIRHFCCIGV